MSLAILTLGQIPPQGGIGPYQRSGIYGMYINTSQSSSLCRIWWSQASSPETHTIDRANVLALVAVNYNWKSMRNLRLAAQLEEHGMLGWTLQTEIRCLQYLLRKDEAGIRRADCICEYCTQSRGLARSCQSAVKASELRSTLTPNQPLGSTPHNEPGSSSWDALPWHVR